MLFDGAIVAGAALAAHVVDAVFVSGTELNIGLYGRSAIIAAIAAMIIFKSLALYDFRRMIALPESRKGLLKGFLTVVLVVLSIGFFAKTTQDVSRIWVLIWLVGGAGALLASRVAVAGALNWGLQHGALRRRVAIVGSGPLASRVLDQLAQSQQGIDVVGVYDGRPQSLTELIAFARTTQLDDVIVAVPSRQEERIVEIVKQLSVLPTDIRLSPDFIGLRLKAHNYSQVGEVSFLDVKHRPMKDWSGVVKKAEDKILSALLLLLLAPVMAIIAIAIRLDSPGPILFRQRRHGFNQQIIHVLKFRTMTVAEDGARVVQARRNDDRVTLVGRFLRKSSLDELPQLWNVLRGEMSLVGPRPHALAHNEAFADQVDSYLHRHRVKPGITGWAQINGYRGELDNEEKLRGRLGCDLHYIENWSLFLDLKILFLTLIFGLFHHDAY